MNNEDYPRKAKELVAYSHRGSALESRPPAATEQLAARIEQQAPLANYWYVLVKRRWTIVAIVIFLTSVAAVLSFMTTPVYEATARLEIEPETPLLQTQSSSNSYEKADDDDTFLQTQVQVLRSDNLVWQTIQQLKLADHLAGMPQVHEQENSEDRKVQLLGAFDEHLKVEQMPRTRMLLVSFDDSDPRVAAETATALANNYLEYNFQEKDQAIRRSGWMENQVESLKKNVEQSEEALVEYEQINAIVNYADKQNILEQMLADESRDLASAQSERIQKESLYHQVTENRGGLASLVHDDLLEKLEEKSADLKQQYTETAAQYGPNFPNAKRLQLEINEDQVEVEREQNRIISRIGNDYNAAVNREKLAAGEVVEQKAAVGNLNQLMVRDNMLRHEFETNQQLYESVLQRLKDATVSAALRSTNIHLVDTALPPVAPIRPRRLLNLLTGLWAGLIIGVIAAFAQEGLDSSIKTAEEAEGLVLAPALGVIPFERGSWFRSWIIANECDTNRLALTLTKSPGSQLSEAFRALGTAVTVPSNPIKSLLITSAQNGEGKTTTALNLAQALAQRKGPVLLIDGDLRKGDLARSIGQSNDNGLTAVLSGAIELSEALIMIQPNLWLLPAGATPVDPVAVLASQEMGVLLEKLACRFESLIIDSPPVLAVTDAAVIASLVSGVLLVTASGVTSKSGVVRARKVLEASGAKILGTAVNKLDPRQSSYGYMYSQYGYK